MQLRWCCGDPELALAGARCMLSKVPPQQPVVPGARRALGNGCAGRVCACLHASARTTADGLECVCAADTEFLTFKFEDKLN